ncbi:PREDICTED: aquaporin-3-like [Priapulus caudatus]|uniref:Aquaporin-3-like n=1 Tax=Priapulus caudatus TaxID=37621 RepID=A0ABM1EXV7_PRICU|nr:PREDICTED: aquaporin-3-like [Priapulus caudatus]
MSVPKGLIPVSVGATVGAIGMAYGYNCGYAVNPARDLGPRILTAMAGWGVEVFSYRDYNWFWIPVVGPHIGAIAGALLYQLFVGVHWPDVPISVGHYPKEKMTTGGINNAFSPPEEFEQEPQVKIYTKQADDDDEMTAKF